MIDIEKFICSLLADHPEGVAVRGDIHRALKEQGLEYKDGKIVPIEDKTELKESEDERTRKELIQFIKNWKDPDNIGRPHDFPMFTRNVEQCDRYIAWLEKQKEFVSADFDDVWETADCDELTALLEKYTKDAIKKMCHAWYDKGIELERKSWLEKQGQTFTKKDVDDAYLKGVCDAKHELEKQGEQKIVWSEDDEEMLNQVIEDVVKLAGPYVCYYKDVNWLKSLKDKVRLKQEWSDENNRCLMNAIYACEQMSDEDYAHSQSYLDAVNWLKSLKDRAQSNQGKMSKMCPTSVQDKL